MNEEDVVINGELVENSWFVSAINGNLNELKKMKNNAGKRDDNGCSALMYCANLGYVDCVEYIVKNLPTELKLKDKNGNTALMYAAMNGQLQIAKILIYFEEGIRNNENKTAYNLAIENEYKDCAKFLEKFENKKNSEDDDSGKNIRKDLEKLQRANKDMDKLVEQQKTKQQNGNRGMF